jgi:hypothetical protein
MKKILYLLKETFYMLKKHRAYFLAPMLIILVLLAVIVFCIGPSAIVAFIYAGI